MEKEKSKIRVQELHSGQILLECDLDESERAHAFAAQMEEMGVEVKVISPTLNETLTEALGLSQSARAEYFQSLEEEMDDHDGHGGSCCFEETKEKIH